MAASFLIILGARSSAVGVRLRLAEPLDPAAVFEELFSSRGWEGSWRDGVSDYVHYHSRIHGVLGGRAEAVGSGFGATADAL